MNGGGGGKSERPMPLLLLLILVGLAAFGAWYGFFREAPHERRLSEFRAKMRGPVDVSAIRNWFERSRFPVTAEFQEVDRTLWPPAIVTLYKQDFKVFTDGKVVLLQWGTAPARIGLVVGTPEATMPPSDEKHYRLPLDKGAWVWHEVPPKKD